VKIKAHYINIETQPKQCLEWNLLH
jgi:hypothetical protein